MTIYWKLAILALVAIGSWHISAKYHETAWQEREAAINAEAATKIAAADKRVRDAERAMAVNLVAVDTVYQTKLQEKDHALDVARTAAHVGGLWVNAACPPVAGNAAATAPAAAGLGDGQTRVRLSEQAADFLIGEASRADRIVEQLTACQQVITADRALR